MFDINDISVKSYMLFSTTDVYVMSGFVVSSLAPK